MEVFNSIYLYSKYLNNKIGFYTFKISGFFNEVIDVF